MKTFDLETVRGEISHHISPVIGWLRLDAANGKSDTDGKRHEAWLERLDKAAEAIVELSKEQVRLEYAVVEVRSDSTLQREMTRWSANMEYLEEAAQMFLQGEKWGNDMRKKAGLPTYGYQIVSRPVTQPYTVVKEYK